ncbi:Uncharacterized protein APZ42_020883 [Daphnia magna]|uniref:Uncharacterized protein n=1 Tax=Daphnia magna TaxID=35525 RepID=A0A164X584_9CRUS|nr:Uncharacterized protein APZ42_020883 [Daphnia magna]
MIKTIDLELLKLTRRGKPVDPLAESLHCSQAKKGGPKIRNPFADCNKENREALASKSSNNGGTSKRIPLSDCSTGNRQPLISKASNHGTLINLASPREHFEMINRINPIDRNVTVVNNLFGAAQGEGTVTLHDFGANDLPLLSERLASTESEASDACFSTMDLEPTLNSTESESISGDPKTSSANDPSDVPSSNSYEEVLSKIKELSLIPISCTQHPGTLPYLIMEYVHIRFHFEAKRYQNLHLSKQNASILNHKKLSKIST